VPQVGEKLALLDSASLYFRAFFGVPTSTVAPDGTPVNAVRGFLDMVATLVSRFRPTDLVACWDDDWRPQWRVDLIPEYKAHRVADAADDSVEEVPDLLEPQVPVIAEALATLGLARVGAPGYEADDVIGTYATAASMPVDVVTGDRDLFQLVDDRRQVRVVYTGRGVNRAELVDEAWLRAKYGVDGRGYADLAVLRGDPSDGLPGVRGIGEKTAAGLLDRFGTLESLMQAVAAGEDVPKGTALREAGEYLAAAQRVVAVATDVELPAVPTRIPRQPADPERWNALVERWGLGGSATRVEAALFGQSTEE
jgi:5'-3' exonuclease